MKKFFLFSLCMFLLCTSCTIDSKRVISKSFKTVTESGNVIEKTYNLGNFDEIDVAGSLDVKFVQAPGKYEAKVSCCDNIMELLDIKVVDDALKIGFKSGANNIKYKKMDITVYAPTVEEFALAGSGSIDFSDGLDTEELLCCVSGSGIIKGMDLNCKDLETKMVGSGDIKIANIACKEVDAAVMGSGTITLAGNADEAEYTTTGSGDIKAVALVVGSGSANITGSGDIECNVKNLKKRVIGSGDIRNLK